MRRLLPFMALVLGTTGCFTRYHKANELAEQGKFVEAAAMFEALAVEHPDDSELPKLLSRARYRAVEQALGRARQARLRGDTPGAQQQFAHGLELRHLWAVKLDGALESTVEDEREAAVRALRHLVAPRTQKGEALFAEAIVGQHDFLLRYPELSGLRAELRDATAAAGRSTCERLLPTRKTEEPYLSNLVARYCGHFGKEAEAGPPLPDAFGELSSRVDFPQAGGGETEMRAALEVIVRQSPFFSEGAPKAAELSARGSAREERSERPVMLSAQWEERVPYEVEVVTELEESVPVTECEAYEERDSNAPGGKVARYREVTKNKTKTREVVVKETRYRDVPRSFDYQAIRVERGFRYSARAELFVGEELYASAGQENQSESYGYSHDVSFDAANVRPQRPQFPDFGGWTGQNGQQLVAKLGEALVESYKARFCTQASPTAEESARCARGGSTVPFTALSGLVPLFGADAEERPRILGPLTPSPTRTSAR